jgi:hypothetical protein
MSDQHAFLRAQVKAFHPNWTKEQIEAEIEKILKDDEGEDCLYCGS